MKRILIVIFLITCTGCSTVMKKTSYSPVSPPVYTHLLHGCVIVSDVIDKRDLEPSTFYKSDQWDKANYDRSVCDIVREALEKELTNAGLEIQKPENINSTTNNCITLKAEVVVLSI